MSVSLRLSRQGAKKNPQYLIVAVNSRSKRDGAYLERLGHYYPKAKELANKIKVNLDAVKAWQSKGAQSSKTLHQLLKKLGVSVPTR